MMRRFLSILAAVAASLATPRDSAASATLSLAVTAGNVPPGGLIGLQVRCEGAAPDALVVKIAFDTNRLSVWGAAIGAAAATAEKAMIWRATEDGAALVIYAGSGTMDSGHAATVYLEAESSAAAGSGLLAVSEASAATSDARALSVQATAASLTIAPLASPHSADTDANGRIGLGELLRVVQLYNIGDYGCDPDSEDGFAPGGADRNCAPHTLDFRPPAWTLDLSELLRAIQLYNATGGAYHADPEGEDGIAPGLPG